MPLDSLLAAYQRAAKGDSLNATAWENIAHVYQQKGDTLKAIDALTHELAGPAPTGPRRPRNPALVVATEESTPAQGRLSDRRAPKTKPAPGPRGPRNSAP